ncbi:ABC transporter permease [Nonomuraea sp. 10N515B]|uniref:ABC transporter permease n=1 Tax=Nonomuraea sp. 10N515B TaxID=3457422 RepID=UPI003FCDFA84
MKALIIGWLNLRRLFRDRNNIFYVIIVPILMVFLIGTLFGGGRQLRLGVAAPHGPLAGQLVAALAGGDGIVVELLGGDEVRAAVADGRVHAGLVIPDGYDAALARGTAVRLTFVARPVDQKAQDVGVWVRSVVRQESSVLRAAQSGAGTFGKDLATTRAAAVPGIDVSVTTTGKSLFPAGFRQFEVSAPPLLLLFTFFTSLTAAAGLIETRRRGVGRRMVATPTPARTIVIGEAVGRLAVAVAQGLIIMLGSALLFGVRWGDPVAAGALLLVFALVGSGAATLIGALLRTEGSALALASTVGLGLAALGGTMVPLESFGDTMRAVAHLTPHAWGYEAFAELVRHGANLIDILPSLAVLAAYAAALFALGLWRLRRALTR